MTCDAPLATLPGKATERWVYAASAVAGSVMVWTTVPSTLTTNVASNGVLTALILNQYLKTGVAPFGMTIVCCIDPDSAALVPPNHA